jgi:hypothetical protein
VRVHLRYEKRAIPLVIERLWHPSQEMIENEDGTLDLTMQVAVVPELVRWCRAGARTWRYWRRHRWMKRSWRRQGGFGRCGAAEGALMRGGPRAAEAQPKAVR